MIPKPSRNVNMWEKKQNYQFYWLFSLLLLRVYTIMSLKKTSLCTSSAQDFTKLELYVALSSTCLALVRLKSNKCWYANNTPGWNTPGVDLVCVVVCCSKKYHTFPSCWKNIWALCKRPWSQWEVWYSFLKMCGLFWNSFLETNRDILNLVFNNVSNGLVHNEWKGSVLFFLHKLAVFLCVQKQCEFKKNHTNTFFPKATKQLVFFWMKKFRARLVVESVLAT